MDLDTVKAVVSGINLKDALLNVAGKSITDRSSGLNDLKRCFDPKSRASWDGLSDKAFNKIFDILFQNAQLEKKLYLEAKKLATQKASARLSANAEVIHNVVKAAAGRLKRKTVEMIMQKITDVVLLSNGQFCEPVTTGYLRALLAILEYAPNVEHLSGEYWGQVLDFCLTAVESYHTEHDLSFSAFSRSRIEGTPDSRAHTPARQLSIPEGGLLKKDAEVLIECIRRLAASTNAPVLEHAPRIFNGILHFIQCQGPIVGPLHQVSFSIINLVVTASAIDNTRLVQTIGQALIPIITRLWASKVNPKDEMLNAAKDEMLITLLTTRLHVERSLKDGDALLERSIRELRDTLSEEYSRRQIRDQLQIDDLDFSSITGTGSVLGEFTLQSVTLKPYAPRAERTWATLQILGFFDGLLLENSSNLNTQESLNSFHHGNRHSRKRRRITIASESIIEPLLSMDVGVRTTALQSLTFTMRYCQLPPETLGELLKHLLSCTLDKRDDVASWALLAISSCSYQASATDEACVFDWIQLWHTTAKMITMSATCRVACHLLHTILSNKLVRFRDIAEAVNSMFTSADLSGPVSLWDTSLALLTHLLHIRNIEVATGSASACNNAVRWFSSKWMPLDKFYLSSQARYVHPVDTLNLLRVALGLSRIRVSSPVQLPCESIGQAWYNHVQNERVLKYLLLLDPTEKSEQACQCCPAFSSPERPGTPAEKVSNPVTKKLLLELLLSKYQDLSAAFQSLEAEQFTQLNQETLRSFGNACVLGNMILPLVEDSLQAPSAADQFDSCVRTIGNSIVSLLSEGSSDSGNDEILLQVLQPYLPSNDAAVFQQTYQDYQQLLLVMSTISGYIHQRRLAFQDANDSGSLDMDIDFDFESQQSRYRQEALPELSRRDATATVTKAAFYTATTTQLALIAAMCEKDIFVPSIPPGFINFLLNLDGSELMLSRDTLSSIFHSDLQVDGEEAVRILRHIGEVMMQYDYECCELTLLLCLDVLESLAPLWTLDDSSELVNAATDFYEWFIKVAQKRRCSPGVLVAMSKLLFQLMHLKESFGENLELPSVRTSLFNILEKGTCSVQFYIGDHLADLFGLFVLKYHDAILTDLLACLPEDPDYIEGLAFRMHVFGQLASRWPSLLRRCVYHIFEIPGSIPAVTLHAKRCLQDLSQSLGLKKPQLLFQLFASQLLYTWLEGRSFQDIPFDIFGYESLLHLLKDTKDEAAALMFMRNQNESFDRLAELLAMEPKKLLSESFGKILGYSIASDISVPRSDESEQYISGEARLKKLMGDKSFVNHLLTHHSEILAVFFLNIDHDRQLEKAFAKDAELMNASEVLTHIKSLSASQHDLPPGQQPTFRSKYLGRELVYFCRKMKSDISTLFYPAMLVFIARKLLGTMHPALGSQHACSVIRKIRVLVALAGSQALQAYPLEMLLHSIRPFVTDAECVDDALGVVQYLIQQSSNYLSQTPSFVAGISVSLLVSLRIFMESSQESTTQEAQYKDTLSNARRFHHWLGSWLKSYSSPHLTGKSSDAFHVMVQAAHGIRTVGNAVPGTSESNLLLAILEDERSGRRLLNQPSRKIAFSLLCADFERPGSRSLDILGQDEIAAKYGAVLWSLCHSQVASKPFLAWAGRVMGRAFVSTGQIERNLLQESDLRKNSSDLASRAHILQRLQGLMFSDNSEHVGLVEATLRIIIFDVGGTPDEESLDYQVLTDSTVTSCSWNSEILSPSDRHLAGNVVERKDPYDANSISRPDWIKDLTISLANAATSDVVLKALPIILREVDGFAEDCFSFILHQVLAIEYGSHQKMRRELSFALRGWMQNSDSISVSNLRRMINAVLYLRTQPIPQERSSADRLKWLDIDYLDLAQAALRCGMYKTALLFTEIYVSETNRASRRSSSVKLLDVSDILLSIFKNLDDPDIYYGVQQESSLSSILSRLEQERDGFKSLSFRGAQYDDHLRISHSATTSDAQSLIGALSILSLDGLSSSLLQAQNSVELSKGSTDSMFRAARRLEQWDIPVPTASSSSSPATIYKVFQSVNSAANRVAVTDAIDGGLGRTLSDIAGHNFGASELRSHLQSLAILTELDEVFSTTSIADLEETFSQFQKRSHWMKTGRVEDVSNIVSCRETTLSSISRGPQLRAIAKLSMSESRLFEVHTLLLSSSLHRAHGTLQESLATATRLTGLIESCQELGLEVDAAIHMETASALWEQGEIASSIGMLKTLESSVVLKKQTIPVGKSDLLARIGYQVSVARLEKPDMIMDKYLTPALKELRGREQGTEAGQVFHEFAVFCDKQLQDPDNLEDLERLKKLKLSKESEVADLTRMQKNASSDELKQRYRSYLTKARQWLELDNQEYRRLQTNRDNFLKQCLENYLLALIASDEHDSDALRFTSLWLEHSDQVIANEVVEKHLGSVPTRKFASLMNQLSSRLLDDETHFQQLLFALVVGICTDHPYHGMYQIWAGYKSKSNTRDNTAVSRHSATKKVAKMLAEGQESYRIWSAIDHTNKAYCGLAAEKYKAGQKLALKDSPAANSLNNLLQRYHLPPPTMQVEISPSLQYDDVPTMTKLENQISIASGVSAPKIITVVASSGGRFKQLVKGGNDDLRQDAIMEQVFGQVSGLLRTNRATRQRNLGIRTYKVLPLTSIAGIIEFVPNTIPLHEYLMPAHERYYPKDLRGSQCRKEISEVQQQKLDVKVKKFRSVIERFNPVMRYFFMEKFQDPDEWFAKRLAYTRSTAAISILGYVLGLGDRHGHNILLDHKTGEAVHIDLGVAFETGRILPVPEVVPFRLTRDIVDGMGITKTEGVFRRCCEFTLEALRRESYSIMTILDVLRYDPLYSWSISPVRLAKLQDAQSAAPVTSAAADGSRPKGTLNEPSEADRALTVVNKKLSKTLSVTATVNDLINQATDERNLAALYSGWAAYA